MKPHIVLPLAIIVLALTACASGPSLEQAAGLEGESRAEIIRQLGQPLSAEKLPDGGERLTYTATAGYGVYAPANDGRYLRDPQRSDSRLDHVPLGAGRPSPTQGISIPSLIAFEEQLCPLEIILDSAGVATRISADASRCAPRG